MPCTVVTELSRGTQSSCYGDAALLDNPPIHRVLSFTLRLSALLLILLSAPCFGQVVINEIMYHPQTEKTEEEFIELHNVTTVAVDLSGWSFTSGVAFTFPAGTSIPANGYLVAAAVPATFHALYPTVANYVSPAGWTGQLSNSSNHTVLQDSLGNKRDEVTYADDGDWAERQRD